MSADDAFEKLQGRLGDFAGFGYRVAFDLGDDGVIAVDGTETPPIIEREAGEPACTIRLSADNLDKLIDGQLNPMMAYTLGKLKIEGSMGVAMKVASLLEE
jgi:putative sterol carrier protein